MHTRHTTRKLPVFFEAKQKYPGIIKVDSDTQKGLRDVVAGKEMSQKGSFKQQNTDDTICERDFSPQQCSARAAHGS